MQWLWVTLPVALFLSWLHPRVWPRFDVREFNTNGSKDSLLETFHRQRFTWRAVIATVINLLAIAPLYRHPASGALLGGAFMVWQMAYWTYDFNPRLNLARNLPYIGKYHVSWNPRASLLDRYVWLHAWLKVATPDETEPPAQEDLRVVAIAGPLYKKVLTWILRIGLLLAGILASGAWLVV